MLRIQATGRTHGEADETLMARYAAGDIEAFDELFQRYEARAYAFFLRRTRSPQRAEDLYQELFLRIHRARDRYDPARPFSPWFFQIARRLLLDDHRRAFRSHEVPIEDREVRTDRLEADQLLVDREQLGEALGSLSFEERELVLSAKLDGVGYPELAVRLGKSVDAVKKAVSRAIQRARGDSRAEAAAS
jgi:RNA polymerase sigma-70 factor (ECF subfamily)